MDEIFDPETMLLTDEFLERYEKALMKLPKRELWIWLQYRSGMSVSQIARGMRTYPKKISRRLKNIQKKLRKWCLDGIED